MKVRVAGKDQELVVGTAAKSEAVLGVPRYPGAKTVPGASVSAKTDQAESSPLVWQTADLPDAVIEYYKGHVPESHFNSWIEHTGAFTREVRELDGRLLDEARVVITAERAGKADLTEVTIQRMAAVKARR